MREAWKGDIRGTYGPQLKGKQKEDRKNRNAAVGHVLEVSGSGSDLIAEDAHLTWPHMSPLNVSPTCLTCLPYAVHIMAIT